MNNNSLQDRFEDVSSRWSNLLIENAFARHHRLFHMIKSGGGSSPTPILDDALPGMLLLRVVSMFDDILEQHINDAELIFPRDLRSNLHGRIELLGISNLVSNAEQLHEVRVKRNQVAHDSSFRIVWNEYDYSVACIHAALSQLDLVPDHQLQLSCKSERSALTGVPDAPKVLGEFTYSVSVFDGENLCAKYEWKERLMND
ncbi:MAG: hypothetical protein AAF490_32125 [Chloroflexota bacterium]